MDKCTVCKAVVPPDVSVESYEFYGQALCRSCYEHCMLWDVQPEKLKRELSQNSFEDDMYDVYDDYDDLLDLLEEE